MEKAYDVKVLLERLKAKGLDLAEKGLVDTLDTVNEWVGESAKLSATPLDDMAHGVGQPFVAFVKTKIDLLDGQAG